MMRAHLVRIALFISMCALAPTVFAQTAASAQAFVEKVYASYSADGGTVNLSGKGRDAVASSSLAALVRKNQRLLRGEAGYLGMDPVCQCQDHDVKDTHVDVHMRTKTRADANASFLNNGEQQRVKLNLLWQSGQWRIDDISSPNDTRSLRQALAQEIREAAKAGYGTSVRK
ncbi:DUF3828 domain-containing protein [Paraburkholderia tropica]|uniref:DUF3828 domain-containing protein n=1 Tax=Paraburkholderia tropica TaxID=92647 RepID=UPI001602DEAB|nr:DUF3828 domain-containing protein [Paraburkholderia tropica]QNB14635.1 DUF3828 domain-containing protein [Paraburkholderia tropica]